MNEADRRALREEYLATRMKTNNLKAKKGQVLSKEDMLNLPRHQAEDHGCFNMDECPLCYKCRNFNSTYAKCRSCPLAKDGLLCKTNLHTPQVLAMMIKRPRIDLDGE